MTYLTGAQAAKLVGCSERTIRRHLTPDGRIGQAYDYNEDAVQQFAATWVNGKTHKRPLPDNQKRWQITPQSRSRARKPGAVGLYNAMRKIIERRPELAEVITR